MLVGRDTELSRLAQLIEGARAGRGGALLIRGEAGIGKTSLLIRAQECLGDVTVVRITGRESEASFSYGALREGLGDPFDQAVAGLVEPYAVARATLALLSELAQRRPVVVLIDDLQWVDRSSMQVLLFVARRVQRDRIAVIATYRPFHGEPIDTSDLDEITLNGLDVDAAAVMLRDLASDLVPAVIGEVCERTNGNPLAMREVVHALHPRQRTGARPVGEVLPAGPEVYRRVGRRLRSVSRGARTALLVVAAEPSGDRTVIDRACDVLEVDDADVDAAFALNLLVPDAVRYEFVHPLVRSAVYGSASSADRRRVHAALAGAVDDHERRVWHRAAAARRGDETVAAELEQLAVAAMQRGDLANAAHAWERAATVGGDGDRRAGRYLAAAAVAAQGGYPADHFIDRVHELTADVAMRTDAYIIRAMMYAWQGRHGEVAAIAEKALVEVAATDPARAAIVLAVSAVDQWYQLKTAAAASLARQAFVLADHRLDLDHPFGAAPAVMQCFVESVTGCRTEGLASRCAEALLERNAVELATPFFWSYVFTEDLDEALAFGDAIVERARTIGAAAGVAWILTVTSAVALRQGDFARAAVDGTEALSLAPRTAGPLAYAYACGHLALLAFHQGRYDDALELAERSIEGADALLSPVASVIGRVAKILTEHRDAPERRVELLGALWAGLVDDGLLSTGYFFVAGSLIDSCLAAGDEQRVRSVIAEIESFPDGGVGVYTRALITRSLAVVDGSEAGFELALAQYGAINDRLGEAQARMAYADLLRRKRRRSTAREQLDLALVILQSIGAVHWIGRVEGQLARLDERRRIDLVARVTLSPQEYRIATEVINGGTNREIAARLFLSVKSVEWHLTRIYRKLGVTSRSKLIAYVANEGLPPVAPE